MPGKRGEGRQTDEERQWVRYRDTQNPGEREVFGGKAYAFREYPGRNVQLGSFMQPARQCEERYERLVGDVTVATAGFHNFLLDHTHLLNLVTAHRFNMC